MNFFIFSGHGDNQNNSKHCHTLKSSSLYEWFYGMWFICVHACSVKSMPYNKRCTVVLTDYLDMHALSVHVNESVLDVKESPGTPH